jgi:hypothetical protein
MEKAETPPKQLKNKLRPAWFDATIVSAVGIDTVRYAGFVHSRNFRQRRNALWSCDGQRAQASRLDMLDHIGNVVEQRLYLPTYEIGHRGRTTLVGDVRQVDPCHHLEQLHRKVIGGPVPGRCVGNLARGSLGRYKDVFDRFER